MRWGKMLMPVMRVVVGPVMVIAGLNPNYVEHVIAHAALSADHVCKGPYLLGRPAQHYALQAVVMIEVDERGRSDDVMVRMLHLR